MASKQVGLGFVLSAIDKASAPVRGLSRTMQAAFRAGARSVVALDHALNLLRKAWRILNHTIGEVVRTALKFQTVAVRREFHEFGRSIDQVKARIGDALLPTVLALKDTLGPLLVRFQAWLRVNREVIASGIGEWTAAFARLLAGALFFAVETVAKAFFGWRFVWALLQNGWRALEVELLTGMEKILTLSIEVATAARQVGLAQVLSKARAEVHKSLLDIGNDLLAHKDDVELLQAEWERLRQKFIGGKISIEEFIAAYERAVKARAASTGAGGATTFDEEAEAIKRATDALRQHERELMRNAQLAEQFGSSIGQAFGEMAAGELTAAEAARRTAMSMVRMFKDIAVAQITQTLIAEKAATSIKRVESTQRITMNAAEGASGAAASQAMIPGIGPILAVAAAAFIFEFILAYLAKFAHGGVVGRDGAVQRVVGGMPGRDSVPILAQQGELIIPVPMAKQLAGLLGRPAPSGAASGGRVQGGAGGGGPLVIQTLVPPTRTQLRKTARLLWPELRTLMAMGQAR